ncbi:MAG TPA: MFS transporter [Anaerolineales bacterium]|jgi:MFS family permease|nr:MFS transporter [Anaerolineales bacterium]
MKSQYKLYGYRWVVLAVFMFINLTIQTLWISYAPITGPATQFYNVSDLKIGMLSMVFMIAYVPLSLPVSWLIDTYGIRFAVGLGSGLMAVFGLARGISGANYNLVLFSTVGIAAAQPFLLNAWTSVPAKWFPVEGRATAVGLVTLSNLVGAAVGMALTPVLIETMPIPTVQLIYGAIAAFSAVLFLLLAREAPPTPPCPPGQETRALVLDGLKYALTIKPFLYFLAAAFIGLGLFNGISTWVEGIIRPRGFSPADAGTLGALMIAGGLVGAIVLPALSDKQQKRQRFLMIAFVGAIPGLIGLTFATSSALLFLSAVLLGFFLVSALPIGMQYSAEITNPTPEGTSNGLIQLSGQAAVVFVYIMEAMRTEQGAFTPSLLLGLGLLMLCAGLVTQMKDPQPR